MYKRQLTFSLFFLFIFSFTEAQVVINEYSASNLNSFVDRFGKTEDWIELYNTSSEVVDLSGYHLSDKESKPGKWEIPGGTTDVQDIQELDEFLVYPNPTTENLTIQ